VKQEVYTLGQESGAAFLEERPKDARLELIFASFLAQYGQLDEALRHLETARTLSPRKQRVLFQTGITLIQGGAVEQALVPLKEAFELEPRYDQARIYYVAGLSYAGKRAEADALLVERFGTTVVDNDQLLGVYADTKQYDRVIGIWLLRVENNPNDAQTHIGLATVYFTAGDNESAIAELQRAAQLDLSLASQIQTIISQIKSGQLKP
jgi:Flp pilus assembly protein TadD